MFEQRLRGTDRGRLLRTAGITVLVGLLAAVLTWFSLVRQRHLSRDFKTVLVRALVPGAPEEQAAAALVQAGGHLHTRHDREAYAKLQQMVAAATAARTLQAGLGRRLKETQSQLDRELHSDQLMLVTEQAYLRSHRPVPPALAEDVAREQILREQRQYQQRRDDEGTWLALLQQRLEARALAQELRVDVGLERRPQP